MEKKSLSAKIMPLKFMGRAEGFYPKAYNSQTHATSDSSEIQTYRRSSVLEDLQEFSNSTEKIDSRELKLAVTLALVEFKLPTQSSILHMKDAFRRTDLNIWTESPGLPWSQWGYATKNAIRNDPVAIQGVRRFWHFVKNGKSIEFPDCCALLANNHENQSDMDWLYPATITFGEAMFAVPLLNEYKELLDNYVGLDFEDFDKTVPAWLIEMAFEILLINIDFRHYQNHGVPDTLKMIQVYYSLRDYFIHTKVRLSDGRRFKKNTGIPNGSLFAPLIRMICNALVSNYISLKLIGNFAKCGLPLENKIMNVKPKDFPWACCYAKQFGMTLKAEPSRFCLW